MSCTGIDRVGNETHPIMTVVAAAVGLMFGGLTGCAEATNPDAPDDSKIEKESQTDDGETGTTQNELESAEGELTFAEKKPEIIEGSFEVEEGPTVEFSSETVNDEAVRVELRYEDKVISALTNRDEGVASVDMYSVRTGETAEIGPEDRKVFRGLRSSFRQDYAGRIDTNPIRDLESYLNIFSKYPGKADKAQFFFGGGGSGYTMECSEPKCETEGGDYSFSGTCEEPDSEIRHAVWFDDCGHPFCGEDKHMDDWGNHPSSTFECYGQCGPGCGGISRTNVYTDDCADHDGCDARHATFGVLCSDEFMKAVDDFAFAPSCD